MKRILIVLLAVSMLLSGCNNSTEEVQQTEKPKVEFEGEWIVNTSVSELSVPVYSVDTFQPIITKSSSVLEAMKLVYEPLFELGGDLRANGVLADSYSVSSDGLTVEIILKSDVKWHDGNDFTAKDVDYTVNAIMNSDSVYKRNLSEVSSYYPSGNKYIFKLKRPVPNFVSMLTFPIIKKNTTLVADSSYMPMGTGAYKYAGKTAAKRITLVENEERYGGGLGIKKIQLVELKDKETAVAAFETNEVDCITSKALDVDAYTPRGKIESIDYVSNNMVYLGVNFFRQILWGKGTRQALGYVINKEGILEKQLYNRGVAVDVPINPSAWYYDETSRIYSYDVQTASKLLIEDGWNKVDWGYTRVINGESVPLKFEILVNSESEGKTSVAYAIAEHLAAAEIIAEVKAVPYEQYSVLIQNKQFDLFVGEAVMPNNMDPTFLVGSQGNYFTYSSGYMDAIIANLGKTQTEETIKATYAEFNNLFNTDIPFVPLFFRKDSIILDDTVSGEIEPSFDNVYSSVEKWYMIKK